MRKPRKTGRKPPRSLAELRRDYRVMEIDKEEDTGFNREYEFSYWLYLNWGFWSPEDDCHTIHESTVAALLAKMKTVEPCVCDQCKFHLNKPKTEGEAK